MPQVNYAFRDLYGGLLAAGVLTPVFVGPGYAFGWALDVHGFRSRALSARLALSVVLSVSIGPALAYLVARVTPVGVVLAAYAAAAVAAAALALRDRPRTPTPGGDPLLRWGAAAAAIWAAYALAQTSDIQVGEALYTSPIAFDYAKHISVTDAIARTGVPPVNPSFLPGHPIALYYYYFWFLLCSLAVSATGAALSARDAVLGGTVWGGVVLMAAVAVYVRDARGAAAPRDPRRTVRVALVLLLVGGLDIVPVALRSLRAWRRYGEVRLLPTVEWWNEQVTGWASSMIWVPHHVAGLVATLTALLLLRDAAGRASARERIALAIACGVAIASALGMSIWVTVAFAAFWGTWAVVALARGDRREAGLAIGGGAAGVVLSLPFLRDLLRANLAPAQRPLGVTIRAFVPLDKWLDAHDVHGLRRGVARLAALPVNYGLEFGFFAVAAVVYWLWRRRRPEPLGRNELALATLATTSILVSTFLKATLRFNDLAPRGIMAAQFVFLLWAAEVWRAVLRPAAPAGAAGDARTELPRPGRFATALLGATFVGGIVTNLYDPVVLRLYPMLLEHGATTYGDVPELSVRTGPELYAIRDVLTRAARQLPRTAIIQPNPHARRGVEPYSHLYAFRQFAAADPEYATLYGVPRPLYDSLSLPIARAFGDSVAGAHAAASDSVSVAALCRQLQIRAWLVTDADPVWTQPDSWVWRTRVLAADPSARVVACPGTR